MPHNPDTNFYFFTVVWDSPLRITLILLPYAHSIWFMKGLSKSRVVCIQTDLLILLCSIELHSIGFILGHVTLPDGRNQWGHCWGRNRHNKSRPEHKYWEETLITQISSEAGSRVSWPQIHKCAWMLASLYSKARKTSSIASKSWIFTKNKFLP